MNSISYSHQIISFFKRIVFLLAFFTITRFLFFIVNFSDFRFDNISQVLRSFVFGIRFDLSVIYYCNLLFIILSLLPFRFTRSSAYQTGLKTLFVLVNTLLLSLNVIDAGYFSVIKRRSGWDMLETLFTSPETSKLIGSYIVGYWHLVVMWLLLVYLIIRFYPKLKVYKLPVISNKITRTALLSFISLFILAGGFGVARGIEGKPLRLISANDYVSPKYTSLLLNTPFSILNTMGHKMLENVEYMPFSEAEAIYSPVHQFKNSESFKNMNVFIVILESFGSEYIFGHKTESKNFTPFLDSLISSGLFCSNAVANSYNSRDAMPAIISGIPSLRGIDYMGSRYSTNTLRSLPIILKEQGYQTSFFHGGHNGTMSFDKFSKVAGMDSYFGYDEFIAEFGESGDDGGWGIYDDVFLQFMAKKVNEFKEPFFTALFTLSSHDPYPIPAKYKNMFPKGELPILESVAYSDFSLRKLFNTIKNEPWFKNTLFVFVADHTSLSKIPEYKTPKTRFAVPILFYAPGDQDLKGEITDICQQADIMPTVLDYLNYNKKFVAYGQSVFSKDYRFAVNYLTQFNIIDSTYTLLFDGEKTNAIYNYKLDTLHRKNLYVEGAEEPELQRYFKAYIQDYDYRMVYNKISDTLSLSQLQSDQVK